MRTSVLIGDKTRENIKELTQCPIVQELRRELIQMNIDIISEYESNMYTFMVNVNREFKNRGGSGNRTLGAVAEAIYTIEKGE